MSNSMQILLVINRKSIGRWTRYFHREYSQIDIKTVDFETLSSLDDEMLDCYSMVIICIETCKDLFEYKWHRKSTSNMKIIHLINADKTMFQRMISHNMILYKKGELRKCVEGLINAVRSDSIVALNCNDVLKLVSESECMLFQGTEGIKEEILFDVVANWMLSKSLKSSLVSIVGDITLADASEICTLIQTYTDEFFWVGCRYEETGRINVSSLWRMLD